MRIWLLIVCALVIGALSAPLALAQGTEFSCAVFGPGYTPHPDFASTCCYPGTAPVPGEQRCVSPNQSFNQPADPPPDPLRPNILPPLNADGGVGAPGGHCIPLGGACTLGGASCCEGACGGTFPNTVCR